ncbi:hypothetical protein Pint_05402 [Pistacia integerrima]|uniref:Uncharacterized protein n=1 Tax=Pistacia integerrima TaxID=434235 RepID=A0ACC0Z4M1_9ROSI|nr:hypothetical protein Pint_05402 [Pistacia integerrima]
MNFSLSSSLKGSANPLLSQKKPTKPSQINPKFISVSCRATTTLSTGENETTNFYKVLSLSSNNASFDEVKRAYKSMALQCHPDICHNPSRKAEATRMFVQFHAAYTTLSDPVLREKYDCELGLRNFGKMKKKRNLQCSMRKGWQDQIVELKKRSSCRMKQRPGSWGSRMRAQNMQHD